jgi:gamma-glutamylcyclotransferase (GGCT)/AIG2-like uncharacterized protein YtfP
MSKTLVAVYGSLRKGMGNSRLLEGVKMLGTTKTLPKFKLFSLGGFPGIHAGDKEVVIEVYETDDQSVLQRLDWLEGYNPRNPKTGLYDKQLTDTEFGPAIIYTYNGSEPENREVPDGDWVKHIEKIRNEKNLR